MKWIAVVLCLFTMQTSASQPAQLVVGPVFQKDAPVQVVGISENGDNALTVELAALIRTYARSLCVQRKPPHKSSGLSELYLP